MAAKENITIDAGATFSSTFQYLQSDGVTPVAGLTGYTARFVIRSTSATGPVELDVEPTFDDVTATVAVVLTAVQTGNLLFNKGVYAIELSAPGGEPVVRLIEGNVTVTPEVVK